MKRVQGWDLTDEACVVCPVCAFTFDRMHYLGDYKAPFYVCPCCAETDMRGALSSLVAAVHAACETCESGYVLSHITDRLRAALAAASVVLEPKKA